VLVLIKFARRRESMSRASPFGLREYNLAIGLTYIACCCVTKQTDTAVYGVMVFGSLYVVFGYIEKRVAYKKHDNARSEADKISFALPSPKQPPPPPLAVQPPAPPKPLPPGAQETPCEMNLDTKIMKAIRDAQPLPIAEEMEEEEASKPG
jgi:hypothetical protein